MERGGPGRLNPEEAAELEALLHLRLLPGVGDLAAARLLRKCGSARSALAAPPGLFAAATRRSGAAGVRWEVGSAVRDQARVALRRAEEVGASVRGYGLPGYPRVLEQLADPPPVLFMKGREELVACPTVAVVGARRATGGGRRFAERLGRVLGKHRVTLVSGLALGIDGAAHRGALVAGGATIAVLGTGIDEVHPRTHRRLQERIGETGLLVTEFPPGVEARPHHFPRRNRILAALARAVVVVEAGARSGALITVDHALDLGRDIYAVPGSVEWEQSRGTNGLLSDGARPLVEPEDLIRRLADGGDAVELRAPGAVGGAGASGGGSDLLHVLSSRPTPTDLLARRVGARPDEVLALLSELELAGEVVREPDGWRRTAGPETGRVRRTIPTDRRP